MQTGLERKCFDFILFSNIYVALCVTGLVVETLILAGEYSLSFPVFVFFSTLFLYNLHRFLRLRSMAKRKTLDLRYRWIRANRASSAIIFVLALCGVLVSLAPLDTKTVICLVPFALIAFGYSVPCIRTRKGAISLRDVPVLKTFFIAFVVSCITVLLPLISVKGLEAIHRPDMPYVLFRRICFVFAIAICFDIRDIRDDKENNLKTLPTLLGIERSKQLSFLALVLFCLLTVAEFIRSGNMDPMYMAALLISAMIAAGVINGISEKKPEYFYALNVEGTMLLQCFLVMVARVLFRQV